MTPALLYRTQTKWRFAAALFSAVGIHLGAISLATTRVTEPTAASGGPTDVTEITFERPEPTEDPPPAWDDPLPRPPVLDQTFIEPAATPSPVLRVTRSNPIVRPRPNAMPGPMHLSSAKAFAVNAPRPEYPCEARRQRITGDGIAVMTIDPGTGSVTQVTMTKSTGSEFLDNAATTGFRRWRFKPGSVSSVTCPVTFTLTGFSY